MTAAPARKYNPGFLSDDELVASFCVRTHEFESLVEALRGCTGDSNQHQIVIGPRGSGKTSLLLRVAAEVRRDADLAAGFFPIVFAEESYEVGTAGEFWLECLARLAIQAPEREDAPDLNTTLTDLRTIHDDRTLGERCLATLLDFADREGKRLVLMVENLNMMFRDMTDRDAGWRLRHVLQTEPRIALLASATSRFNEIDHPDHALYDQFRVLTLRPLNTDESAVLWRTVSGQSRPIKTVRSLEILTGGSPRLLAIVACFGADLSFRKLMDSLFELVDDHTEYFKSHLELLPAQERRVYLALADLWKPALTKEVAERARLETSKCSAQLARLIERGVVRVDGGSSRRKQYYLSERMYNIYYLLRRGTDRSVEVLIQFMEIFYYSPDELEEISTRIASEAEEIVPEMRSLYQSISEKLKAMSASARRDEAASRKDSSDLAEVLAMRALFDRGVALSKQDQPESALAVFEELLRRYSKTRTPELLEGLARTLVNKGITLGLLNRPEEELATYDEVLRRFDNSEALEFPEPVASSLTNKGVALSAMGRPKEALDAYDDVLRRFRDSEVVELHESVATALVNKGAALGGLSRYEEVLVVSDEMLCRFGASETPVLIVQVAKALVNKGIALDGLSKLEEALAAYDEVLHHFDETEVPELFKHVTTALINKGATLGKLNRQEEQLVAYDEALRRLDDSNVLDLEGVAKVLANRGGALHALNRQEEVLASCDEVLRRFADSKVSNLHAPIAKALVNKGAALCTLNRPEEALVACDEVLRRFGDSDDPELLQRVAKALINKSVALFKLGRPVPPPDVAALLAILPRLDLSQIPMGRLLTFSVELGAERMRELIQASPAAELLQPLTTALEREMGLEPRVPEEVSEVVKDIRRTLANMKEARR